MPSEPSVISPPPLTGRIRGPSGPRILPDHEISGQRGPRHPQPDLGSRPWRATDIHRAPQVTDPPANRVAHSQPSFIRGLCEASGRDTWPVVANGHVDRRSLV